MFNKGAIINLTVFLIVLCSLPFSRVDAKKGHIRHHNTTTLTTPISSSIDEDSSTEPVKVKRIRFLHRSHKQNFVRTTISPIADDQEFKNEETTMVEPIETQTQPNKPHHRVMKKHKKHHSRKHKISTNETLTIKETSFLNDTIIQIFNGTNITTTTRINLIDSINQGLKANEPSLTIAFIVGICLVSIIICGCLLKMCYPKEITGFSNLPQPEKKIPHENSADDIVPSSENTPVLNYSRTQQKNIEKFY